MAVTSSASAESSHNRAVGAYPRPKQEISLPEYQASNLSHHLSSNLNDRYDYLVLLITRPSPCKIQLPLVGPGFNYHNFLFMYV